MTTAELMAVAVLKGDLTAARGLADLLMNEYQQGAKELLPVVNVLSADKRYKAIVFTNEDTPNEEIDRLGGAVVRWLHDPSAEVGIVSHHVDRIELYEFPKEGS